MGSSSNLRSLISQKSIEEESPAPLQPVLELPENQGRPNSKQQLFRKVSHYLNERPSNPRDPSLSTSHTTHQLRLLKEVSRELLGSQKSCKEIYLPGKRLNRSVARGYDERRTLHAKGLDSLDRMFLYSKMQVDDITRTA